MKIIGLTLIFIYCLGCKTSNPKLEEAQKLHLEAADLFRNLENRLDSLLKTPVSNFQRVQLKNFQTELSALEEAMIEVPSFENEHNHEGYHHGHETQINYTDDQILVIQKEVKLELEKLSTKF